jgi:hypothetical protein
MARCQSIEQGASIDDLECRKIFSLILMVIDAPWRQVETALYIALYLKRCWVIAGGKSTEDRLSDGFSHETDYALS